MYAHRGQLRTGKDGHIRPLGGDALADGYDLLNASHYESDQDPPTVFDRAMGEVSLTRTELETLTRALDDLTNVQQNHLPGGFNGLVQSAAEHGRINPGSVLSFHASYRPRDIH